MPYVHQFNGLSVKIYFNDHEPPHVHVIGGGCMARFALNCPDGPATMLSNRGFTLSKASKIARELATELGHLCSRWGEIHG